MGEKTMKPQKIDKQEEKLNQRFTEQLEVLVNICQALHQERPMMPVRDMIAWVLKLTN